MLGLVLPHFLSVQRRWWVTEPELGPAVLVGKEQCLGVRRPGQSAPELTVTCFETGQNCFLPHSPIPGLFLNCEEMRPDELLRSLPVFTSL